MATISIPLAFFITFFVLNSLGYTMNFLTNFSLIICLGIAVDTATVIIQGANENIKLGYRPLYAALLAVKTYKNSLISGTATTVVVFLPMMSLPGVMGAFLAYIPITIFITLIASLFISLTITPSLFFKSRKNPDHYHANPDTEALLNPSLQLLLQEERKHKTANSSIPSQQTESRNHRLLSRLNYRYSQKSKHILKSAHNRITMILIPLIIFLATLIFISPHIGFIMMPAADNEYLSITLAGKSGLQHDTTKEQLPHIDTLLAQLPELRNYVAKVKNNTITVTIRILPQSERKRSSFQIESELAQQFQTFMTKGFQVTVAVDKD
ncbi:MAG: efflux RND transporter permease subunit [bacterium]|nr:efflux RND transporter permease subunit [bacterium]